MKYYKNAVCGFTLIEMSIVLLIGGLFMASIGRMYKVYMKQYLYEVNDYKLQQTRDALLLFRTGAGRLPCPANASLAAGDTGYGIEVCPTTAGSCVAGIECVDGRDVNGDGTPERVLIGAVPHITILDLFENGPFAERAKFPDFAAHSVYDAYRTKLRYAVTEELSNSGYSFFNPAPSNIGAISITDEFNESLVKPEGSGQFVVFSHGENGVGGYYRDGTRNTDCIIPSGYTGAEAGYVPGGTIPAGVNSSSIETEKENCDDNDAIFILGSRSLANNSNYYDDTLYYVNITSQELWKASLLSNNEAWYNTNAGFVGMGVDTPQEKLHIGDPSGSNEGDISALSIKADRFCANDGSDCMDPRTIAGNLSQMTCSNPYQAVVAIENNEVVCQTVITSLPNVTCPAGEFLIGVSNLGNVKCGPPP
jgi:prepilin-type N-terminal cleavage/methylation domain-containing protein